MKPEPRKRQQDKFSCGAVSSTLGEAARPLYLPLLHGADAALKASEPPSACAPSTDCAPFRHAAHPVMESRAKTQQAHGGLLDKAFVRRMRLIFVRLPHGQLMLVLLSETRLIRSPRLLRHPSYVQPDTAFSGLKVLFAKHTGIMFVSEVAVSRLKRDPKPFRFARDLMGKMRDYSG